MTPGKLDLLTGWLPGRPWYRGAGRPRLAKVGGFRLDDPEGEVGIEFMAAADGPVTYHVPMSYRAAPLPGADDALIGTAEHGVLGRRWIYDGTHDPVLVERLFALIIGTAQAQAQSVSDTPDPTVVGSCAGTGYTSAVRPVDVADGPDGTDVLGQDLAIRVLRVLDPAVEPNAVGHVTAGWRLPDGGQTRGVFAFVGPRPDTLN
jgi:hypothetical protein